MAKTNKVKKSDLIRSSYKGCFNERAALVDNEKCIKFYELLINLQREKKITFDEMDILESARTVKFEIFLQYIDIEPRIMWQSNVQKKN